MAARHGAISPAPGPSPVATSSQETLEQSIRRHLAVKVDVRELSHLEQLETLSDPRNPRRSGTGHGVSRARAVDLDPAVPGHRLASRRRSPSMAFDHEAIAIAGGTGCAKLVHQPRRARPGDVHDLGAPRPLYRRARHDVSPRTSSEVLLRRGVLERTGTALTGTGRRSPGGAVPLPHAPPRDHGSVPVLRPPPVT